MTIAGMEHPFGVPGGSRTHNAFRRPLLRRLRLPFAVTGTYMRRKTKTEILALWPSVNSRSICFVHYRMALDGGIEPHRLSPTVGFQDRCQTVPASSSVYLPDFHRRSDVSVQPCGSDHRRSRRKSLMVMLPGLEPGRSTVKAL